MTVNHSDKVLNKVINRKSFWAYLELCIIVGFVFYGLPLLLNSIFDGISLSRFTQFEIVLYSLVIALAISVNNQLKKHQDVLEGIGGWFAMIYEGIAEKMAVMRANREARKADKKAKKEAALAEAEAKETDEKKPSFFDHFNIPSRLLVLFVFIFSVLSSIRFPAIMPHVQLPAEQLSRTFFTFLGQEFGLTNTMLASITVYVFLFIVGYSIFMQYKQGKKLLTGVGGFFVMLFEMLYDMSVTAVGKKHAKRIFPLFGTIFIVVMMGNVMELIPGVDSIGKLHVAEHEGNAIVRVTDGVHLLVKDNEESATILRAENGGIPTLETVETADETTYGLYPFVRAAATDLNFTLGIAIVSMIAVQVYGFSNLGWGYTRKFWNVQSLKEAWRKPKFGGPLNLVKAFIDWVVGLLEMVSEVSKVISFTFRLFGVIFAGQVLLFVVGSIIPYVSSVIQGPFYLIEMFFGVLQAYVFGMLTMVFMKIASSSHGEEGHED